MKRRPDSGLDRRRKQGRPPTSDRKSADAGELTEAQQEFLLAICDYRRYKGKSMLSQYISFTEMLEILLYLGYRKVAKRGAYSLKSTEAKKRRGQVMRTDRR